MFRGKKAYKRQCRKNYLLIRGEIAGIQLPNTVIATLKKNISRDTHYPFTLQNNSDSNFAIGGNRRKMIISVF